MIDVRPTDQRFFDSPYEGQPGCVCSRCGRLIPEQTIAVRLFAPLSNSEFRYHPACLGLETFVTEEELES